MNALNPLDEKILAKRSVWQNAKRAESWIRYQRWMGDKHGVYAVATNDTLAEIAERFETTVDELVRLNNIENPNVIYFGTCLALRELNL
mgnify:CR=1 FL=1